MNECGVCGEFVYEHDIGYICECGCIVCITCMDLNPEYGSFCEECNDLLSGEE